MSGMNEGAPPPPGDVHEVRRRLWNAIVAASAIADDPNADESLRLRGVHGVTQASQAYMRVLEAADFEARLAALEAQSSGLL